MERSPEIVQSHPRPARLHREPAGIHYLMAAAWGDKDQVSDPLLYDVDGEGSPAELLERRYVRLPVELLPELLVEVLCDGGRIVGGSHEPERPAIVLRHAHQVVAGGGAEVLVCRRVGIANAHVAE